MKKTLCALLVLAAATGLNTPARAQDQDQPPAREDMLSFGIGLYDALDGDQEAADFRAEYRWGEPCWWQIKPFLGLEFTSDSAIYGLGGLYMDWALSPRIYMTPQVGLGIYNDGDGKDLGFGLQVRSQIEMSYKMDDNSRLGLGLSHISNMGMDDDNPGTEVLSVYYHIPVDWFSGSSRGLSE